MKLISAQINNFRLLKDLELKFSIDEKKPLTVIRAANETGKTTTENALIWGLYGASALPGKGANYPLYPSDSVSLGLNKVEVSVEIEFENDEVVPLGQGRQSIKKKRYKLLRNCTEIPSVDGSFERKNERVVLYEVKSSGAVKVEGVRVHSIIENSIPQSLKDVYFTDGDSAMSFIEAAATQGVKRRRVKDAVEALLGLDILEKTHKHINSVAKKFSKQIDNTDYADELEKLNDAIDGYEEDLVGWEKERMELEESIKEGGKKLITVKKQIEETLKLGDREKLASDIARCVNGIRKNEDSEKRMLLSVASVLRRSDLAASLISDVANDGLKILNELSKKKQLPRVNVPILEELLDRDSCFCGSDLSINTEDGKAKRRLIKESIEKSREADALSESASSLFYSVRSQSFDSSATQKWMEQYGVASREYAERKNDTVRLEGELDRLNKEIDLIKDANLESLRISEESLEAKLSSSRTREGMLIGQVKETQERKADKELIRDRAEKKLNKSDTTSGKLHAARLCEKLLNRVFDRLRIEELKLVSTEMNRIFLDMIGADPAANDLTLITKAELTEEFDIVVYGSHSHMLNPDQDLNGASRRAITLAFILALTKVSRVQAPNVIDTPLGMMAGYVKQSVLERTIEEGSQVILFLTHDEINGVENILDKKAGMVYTLTNPAHYPKMLVNKPSVQDARIIRCDCNHRETCDVCERKGIELH